MSDKINPTANDDFDYDEFMHQLHESERKKLDGTSEGYDVTKGKINIFKTPLRNLFADFSGVVEHLKMYVLTSAILGAIYKGYLVNVAITYGLGMLWVGGFIALMASITAYLSVSVSLLNIAQNNHQNRLTGAQRTAIIKVIFQHPFEFKKYIALHVFGPGIIMGGAFLAASFCHDFVAPIVAIIFTAIYLVTLFHGRIKKANYAHLVNISRFF
jgi:hypothetical protein